MSDNTTLKITDAGKGWYRIWRGRDLLAACPSSRALNRVLTALQAEEDLEIARSKIALLEQSLETELRCPKPFLALLRRR
jgi:hypothetical protein